MEYNVVESMFKTLSELKHKVRTGYGVSELKYESNSGKIPLKGIGQGNGMGPIGWNVISFILFAILGKAGFGAEFISAFSKIVLKWWGTAW